MKTPNLTEDTDGRKGAVVLGSADGAIASRRRLPLFLRWLRQRLMGRSSIEISERAGVRYLHFSSDWVQGAMRVQRPNALELPYTREMMAGLLLREPPWPRQALLIGLGAGSLAKFIYHRLPATRITVVEIDPQVEIVARLHFKLPDDPLRLRVLIADGAEYMLKGDSLHDHNLRLNKYFQDRLEDRF